MMDNWNDDPPEFYNPNYPDPLFLPEFSDVNGACDDAFIEFLFNIKLEPTKYHSPLLYLEDGMDGLIWYCDKQSESDDPEINPWTDFHDPWEEHETPSCTIQLLGGDCHEQGEGAWGVTWKLQHKPNKHKHSFVWVGQIYNDTKDCDYPPGKSWWDYVRYVTTHEIGESMMLNDNDNKTGVMYVPQELCETGLIYYFCMDNINILRDNLTFMKHCVGGN